MDKKKEEGERGQMNKRKEEKEEKGEKALICDENARSLDGDELEGLRVACRLGREVSPSF